MPIPRKLWCLLPFLTLVACSPATPDTAALTQLPVRVEAVPAEAQADLTLTIKTEMSPAPSGYRTQYINVLDWEIADGTLSNTDVTIPSLNRTAAATVTAQLARQASLSFTPVKATGNYTLTINLKRRDRTGTYQTVASGAKASFSLSPGANTATVTITPTSNGQLTVSVPQPTIQFSPPPIVSSFSPTSASAGMLVSIGGLNFGGTVGSNQVLFNGTAGTVLSDSTTALVAQVPASVTSGPLGVVTLGRLGNAATNFTALASGTQIAIYGTGAGPQGIKRDSAGNMWVCNFGGTTLSKLAPDGTLLATYATGVTPYQMCFDANGDVWVVNNAASGGKITKIAGTTGAVIGSWGTEPNADDVAVDSGGYAYTVSSVSKKLHRFKPGGGSDVSNDAYSGGNDISTVVVDGSDNVWVAIHDLGTVSKLSTAVVNLANYAVGNQPSDMALDATGNLWIALDVDNKVVKMLPNGTIAGSYPCPAAPKALSIDPLGNIWLAHTSLGKVTKMASTGTVLGTYTVPGSPADIAFDPTRAVWVTLSDANAVVKLAL
jgi:streptogramin lyase